MTLENKKMTSYIVMIFGALSFFVTLIDSYVTDLVTNFQMPIMLKALLITMGILSVSMFIVGGYAYSWYGDKQSSFK